MVVVSNCPSNNSTSRQEFHEKERYSEHVQSLKALPQKHSERNKIHRLVDHNSFNHDSTNLKRSPLTVVLDFSPFTPIARPCVLAKPTTVHHTREHDVTQLFHPTNQTTATSQTRRLMPQPRQQPSIATLAESTHATRRRPRYISERPVDATRSP